MQGLYISPNGIKGGANLSKNYTTNVLLENMDENTQKFANLVVSNLVSLFKNNPEHAIDYLDFNLVFNGNFDDISNNISFEDFIKSNSDRIIAIFKSVKSSDKKSFIVDFVQSETDYKYDYVLLKLSKLFEIFNNYGIEYKVDENSRVQQHGIYNDDNSTRIIVSYAHAKKYHVGIVSGPTFMSQFMNKLNNGELTLDTCPQVEISPELTQEYIVKQLESYEKLLESGIIEKSTKKLILHDTDYLKEKVKVAEIKKSDDHDKLVEEANSRIEEGRRKEAKAWHYAQNYIVDYNEQGPVKKLVTNNKK